MLTPRADTVVLAHASKRTKGGSSKSKAGRKRFKTQERGLKKSKATLRQHQSNTKATPSQDPVPTILEHKTFNITFLSFSIYLNKH